MTTEPGAVSSQPPHVGVSVAEAPVSSLMLQLVRAHATIATAMLQRIDLVAPQELVLLFLQEHGRTPQSEIVYFLGRDRSTVTNTLQAMERADLITRTSSQTDKRTMIVSLSSKGRRLCPRIREIWSELERMAFGGLTAQQRADLAQLFTDIRQGLPPAGGPYSASPASDDPEKTRR
ncbi:MarR family transcriptional regulator [Dactylosporangium sp. NPDC051484]|uniref:MarR family winged helix-turn-helix transcriptional regulator n=1 Tax=Dactylosporangium sp. NPDC051484 TaxID=3154942 RepID=UPI00344D4F34